MNCCQLGRLDGKLLDLWWIPNSCERVASAFRHGPRTAPGEKAVLSVDPPSGTHRAVARRLLCSD
jgi:hypothetical protein